MLHSFQAQLNGSQLIWIDQPPMPLLHQRVLVVVEDVSGHALAVKPVANPVQGFLNARGCLGKSTRQDVLAGLDKVRDDWNREPLSSHNGKPRH
jgi:hypothetical protein